MTSANANDTKQLVTQYKSLHIDDQLGVLALIYQQISGSIPTESLPKSSEVSNLVSRIEKMHSEEQVDALRDLLPANRTDQDEVILNPHPSQALTELVQGETKVPTGEYGAFSPETKLAFWYQVAQKLGSSLVSIPAEYSPSAEGMKLFNSIKEMGNDEIISFLTQVFTQKVTEPPKNSD